MLFSIVLLCSFLLIKSALANPACAVCTIAVGASLEIARRLGVAAYISGDQLDILATVATELACILSNISQAA